MHTCDMHVHNAYKNIYPRPQVMSGSAQLSPAHFGGFDDSSHQGKPFTQKLDPKVLNVK